MPPSAEIQRYLAGAWQMMRGRPEGLELLDISADGFWNSFYAIVIAGPPLLLGWALLSRDLATANEFGPATVSLAGRLAIMDLATWLLPIAGLVAIARPAGISSRLVHYIVASNWGTAITAWIILPSTIIRMVSPEAREISYFFSLLLFALVMWLGWRLTNVALARGPLPATVLYFGMLAASFAVLFSFQALFSIGPLPSR